MELLPRSTSPRTSITLLLVLLFFMNIMSASVSKAASSATSDHENNKVDKTLTEADEYRTGIKCGSCPCVNSCSQQQLPPPPPPPPPPSPPKNCIPTLPPPPPPRFVYVTGIPGEADQSPDQNGWQYYYSGAGQNFVQGSSTMLLVVGGLVLQLVLIIIFGS